MTEEYMTDDEQLEHLKRVVSENWLWVVGGAVLGLALIFGYRYYEGYRNERALRASSQFDELAAALSAKDGARARQIAGGLISGFPGSPYADQAQLALARLAVDEGKLADAVGPLTQVMDNSKDTELKHIARLRLARVQIDAGKPDDALKTLAEDKPGSFAGSFHEVRGDAFLAKQDTGGALTEYKAALEAGGEGSGVNPTLVQMKITDLGSAAAPAAQPETVAPSASTSPPAAAPPTGAKAPVSTSAPTNKAKP